MINFSPNISLVKAYTILLCWTWVWEPGFVVLTLSLFFMIYLSYFEVRVLPALKLSGNFKLICMIWNSFKVKIRSLIISLKSWEKLKISRSSFNGQGYNFDSLVCFSKIHEDFIAFHKLLNLSFFWKFTHLIWFMYGIIFI